MQGKLRNMTAVYLVKDDKVLLLFRQGGKVVNDVWTGSAGGHFEEFELNDAKACVLRELNEELALCENDIENLSLRYVTLRRTKGEIRQNYYFFARIKDEFPREFASDEGILKWVSFDEMMKLKMPFTAQHVMEHYLAIGRFDHKLYAGVGNEDSVKFLELTEF